MGPPPTTPGVLYLVKPEHPPPRAPTPPTRTPAATPASATSSTRPAEVTSSWPHSPASLSHSLLDLRCHKFEQRTELFHEFKGHNNHFLQHIQEIHLLCR